jgi:ribosomal protein S2
MESVEVTFKLTFTPEQLEKAREYVEDMKKHPKRVYWFGKKGQSDEELVISQIAHRILSGFYNNYDPSFAEKQIISMASRKVFNNNHNQN